MSDRPEGDAAASLIGTMSTETALAEDLGPVIDPREPVARLLRDLRSSASGLTDREAARRLTRYGPNALARGEGRSRWRSLGRQFTHPLALLLLAAAALAALTSSTSPASCCSSCPSPSSSGAPTSAPAGSGGTSSTGSLATIGGNRMTWMVVWFADVVPMDPRMAVALPLLVPPIVRHLRHDLRPGGDWLRPAGWRNVGSGSAPSTVLIQVP